MHLLSARSRLYSIRAQQADARSQRGAALAAARERESLRDFSFFSTFSVTDLDGATQPADAHANVCSLAMQLRVIEPVLR